MGSRGPKPNPAKQTAEHRRALYRKHSAIRRERYPEKTRAAANLWRKQNPEKVKALAEARRLRKYGLTQVSYNSLLAAQGNVCGICKAPDPGDSRGYRWHIDHDHSTGLVRGLLCAKCNKGLGAFGDTLAGIQRAFIYMERHYAISGN